MIGPGLSVTEGKVGGGGGGEDDDDGDDGRVEGKG